MKIRRQRIKGTWTIDGVQYTGRSIDIDALVHLEWHDDVLAKFSGYTATQALELGPTDWERGFIVSLMDQFDRSGSISEKQSDVWDKIALKLGVPVDKKDATRGSLGDLPTPNTAVAATLDEIPF